MDSISSQDRLWWMAVSVAHYLSNFFLHGSLILHRNVHAGLPINSTWRCITMQQKCDDFWWFFLKAPTAKVAIIQHEKKIKVSATCCTIIQAKKKRKKHTEYKVIRAHYSKTRVFELNSSDFLTITFFFDRLRRCHVVLRFLTSTMLRGDVFIIHHPVSRIINFQ